MTRLLLAMLMLGKFHDGYEAENNGVGINIVIVHDGPRCRELDNCAWMLMWSAKKQSETAEFRVFVAGKNTPAIPPVTVPGKRTAALDAHNPVFAVPLNTVAQIEITLRNGAKEVVHAEFR